MLEFLSMMEAECEIDNLSTGLKHGDGPEIPISSANEDYDYHEATLHCPPQFGCLYVCFASVGVSMVALACVFVICCIRRRRQVKSTRVVSSGQTLL